MPRTVGIVQARMGSSRFPGKMMARLGEFAVAEWVVTCALRSRRLDDVVLATSTSTGDDVLSAMVQRLGIAVFRGSEMDVLDRVERAADQFAAEWVVRICADNPFVDPCEIDRLVDAFAVQSADYMFNHRDRLGTNYADGFGAEILTVELLRTIARSVIEPQHREHVTLYVLERMQYARVVGLPAPEELAYSSLRFDLDVPGDLLRLQGLVDAGVGVETSAATIVQIVLSDAREN